MKEYVSKDEQIAQLQRELAERGSPRVIYSSPWKTDFEEQKDRADQLQAEAEQHKAKAYELQALLDAVTAERTRIRKGVVRVVLAVVAGLLTGVTATLLLLDSWGVI